MEDRNEKNRDQPKRTKRDQYFNQQWLCIFSPIFFHLSIHQQKKNEINISHYNNAKSTQNASIINEFSVEWNFWWFFRCCAFYFTHFLTLHNNHKVTKVNAIAFHLYGCMHIGSAEMYNLFYFIIVVVFGRVRLRSFIVNT